MQQEMICGDCGLRMESVLTEKGQRVEYFPSFYDVGVVVEYGTDRWDKAIKRCCPECALDKEQTLCYNNN